MVRTPTEQRFGAIVENAENTKQAMAESACTSFETAEEGDEAANE